jgi:hypothetical protein
MCPECEEETPKDEVSICNSFLFKPSLFIFKDNARSRF